MNVNERVTTFVDEGLGHASYLVDLGSGRALVIDPPRMPTAQLKTAADMGLEIAWTADTHSHADYVSGSPELRAKGATFIASSDANLELSDRPMVDGDELELENDLTLRAVATPGHTPDHLAYLLIEHGAPVALFSGGSLMVGTVGRTDLLGPEPVEHLTRQLFHSLHERILTLPDDLPVYPTHGAGSFCAAPGASERTTTIGHERATNALLAIDDEDTFVRAVPAGFGTFPSYFARLPEVNRRGPRVYGELPDLPTLHLDSFRAALDAGATLVDARRIAAFADAHIRGALSIELRPVFASWLGWLVAADADVVFVLDNEQDRHELVRQCLDVGYERLLGCLRGGMQIWIDEGLSVLSLPLITPDSLGGTVLDVRQANEFAAGHVPGAINVELGAISTTSVPAGPLTVMCSHGERAMSAASLLEASGADELRVLAGGPEDWSSVVGRALEAP
jgi:glyoxylase-like metal-dependent hydrolase (beta-lactamase superfamily II)/rhodanese-related sulfurtransferase